MKFSTAKQIKIILLCFSFQDSLRTWSNIVFGNKIEIAIIFVASYAGVLGAHHAFLPHFLGFHDVKTSF